MNKQLLKIFNVLSIESRLELFLALRECNCSTTKTEDTCMSDLVKITNSSLPNVQRNIRLLEDAGLVEVNKKAQTCFCTVTELGNKLFNLLSQIDGL